MLVFIDESGDAGFKVDRGSSPIFVAAMVIFDNSADAQATEAIIGQARQELRINPEFKFNKCHDRVRDGFFQAVRNCPFTVRAIVVRKEVIYSPHLMTDKEDFYRFFVQLLMRHDSGTLDGARVRIDGSGDREFRKQLTARFRRDLGGRIEDVRFSKSHTDLLVQLADMCVGAIARSFRHDRKNPNRWRRMIQPRIDDVWDFGR